MDYIESLFKDNFLEYASYVIKDRAIPALEDGLKPVQRRILHTLFEMDDGKFHKVANVMGRCMQYHPHGDASIGNALVVLANKEFFIERQGNFGNLFTGDEASAPRYIECRITPFAKEIFHNPHITTYLPSYDGRSKEPTAFRAKIPVVLVLGAEGIAVGMSTKILPHNIREVIEAEKACIAGKTFQLFPDFATGGQVDVSEYADGLGKILVRAKLDTSDEKKIVIRELPFGSTTESIINSIDAATKSGKVKVAEISDYTADTVEIELKLPRGVYSSEVVDSLYAFTECEQSISCNLLVINNTLPQQMTVTQVIQNHSKQLLKILKDELEYEKKTLTEKLHLRTLERIFIEERIYKKIETMKTADGVLQAVRKGFEPFRAELLRDITDEDIDHLLKIPIRRISLYDIQKNREEVQHIKDRIKEINRLLKNLVAYALTTLDAILEKIPAEVTERKTEITSFTKVNVKEAVDRNLSLRYDEKSGYLGTAVSTGTELFKVSPFDRIFIMRKNGIYTVVDIPEKLFVDVELAHCCLAGKENVSKVLFTAIYKDRKTGFPYIKRSRIEAYLLNHDYLFVPDNNEVLLISSSPDLHVTVTLEPKPKTRQNEKTFSATDYPEKGLKANGVKLLARVALSAQVAEHACVASSQDAPKATQKMPADAKTEKPKIVAKTKSDLTKKGVAAKVEKTAQVQKKGGLMERAAAKKNETVEKPKKTSASRKTAKGADEAEPVQKKAGLMKKASSKKTATSEKPKKSEKKGNKS